MNGSLEVDSGLNLLDDYVLENRSRYKAPRWNSTNHQNKSNFSQLII